MEPHARRPLLARLLVVALVLAVLIWARTSPSPRGRATAPSTSAAGSVAAVDGAGNLVPPDALDLAGLAPEIDAFLTRSSAGLEVITEPGGMQWVDLQGRFLSISVARIDAAGDVTTRCLGPGPAGP